MPRYVIDQYGYFCGDESEPSRGPYAGWVSPGKENRTEQQSPYAYSEFFIFRDEKVRAADIGGIHAKYEKGIDAAYSDRLSQWDRQAFDRGIEACPNKSRLRCWGQGDATVFLTAYFGKPTTAHALAEGCNVGNGYPYWIFWYSHDVAAESP